MKKPTLVRGFYFRLQAFEFLCIIRGVTKAVQRSENCVALPSSLKFLHALPARFMDHRGKCSCFYVFRLVLFIQFF